MSRTPSVVILVADGARPDSLATALDGGVLPALAALRAEGGLHTLTSVFPSVTGPAYVPFLLGRHPAPIGLPGLRWLDRTRRVCSFPHYARTYVGYGGLWIARDLDPAAPTVFELAPSGLGALEVIGRGLRAGDQIGRDWPFVIRAARVHFSGDVAGWLDIDRDVGAELARRIRERRPAFAFGAFTGVDKTSHADGHEAPRVLEALRIVDEVVAEIRADAEADGRWDDMHLWVVSDHGHSRVREHEDLAGLVEAYGLRTLAHPRIYRWRPEAAVMVSGNAMAHIYLDLSRRERPWWPELAQRHEPLVEMLLGRPSVDLALLPHSPTRCEIRSPGRGRAMLDWDGGRYRYRPRAGDPLGVGARDLRSAAAAFEATIDSDYPDAIVQIAHLAGASRSGEIILSASRDWDFRSRFEPIPHLSSHGALHREHMLVPLLASRPLNGTPRRTVDVMPSALAVLGIEVPRGVEGTSFIHSVARTGVRKEKGKRKVESGMDVIR
jgi:hypothetical protein